MINSQNLESDWHDGGRRTAIIVASEFVSYYLSAGGSQLGGVCRLDRILICVLLFIGPNR